MPIVTIECRALGRRAPLVPNWDVHIPEMTESDRALRLRDLIGLVVLAELAAFHTRQEVRGLARVLTSAEIERGADLGSIRFGSSDADPRLVEPPAAVAQAIQAFEDGLYFVFVDGQQRTALDEEIRLSQVSHLRFLRLVALAGG